jgi:hypothetical protein
MEMIASGQADGGTDDGMDTSLANIAVVTTSDEDGGTNISE